MDHADDEDGEALELAITDVLDLHSFPPAEIPELVRDYLELAYDKGLRRLRIIHGKGIGVQRRTVRTLLERHPRVVAFGDLPAEHGGWGATWVELREGPGIPPEPSPRPSPAGRERAPPLPRPGKGSKLPGAG